MHLAAGDFDIPASWTAGVALGFAGMGVAVDVQHVEYGDVAAIANRSSARRVSTDLDSM